ncbi:MAG: hypothetical protein AAF387_02170 [Pseudomonadota bacterium]
MTIRLKNPAEIILLILVMLISSQSHAVYTEPTRRLVLNEIIETGTDSVTYPLYLSDAGHYFTEMYLTDEAGDIDHERKVPVSLEVKVEFTRKGKLLRSETKRVEFAPGEINKTLFTTFTPRDLPQRKNMDVTVAIAAVNSSGEAQDAVTNVRLQITRKFEFGPIFVR